MKTSHEAGADPAVIITSYIDREETYGAHNYQPLPIVAAHALGVWITDVLG